MCKFIQNLLLMVLILSVVCSCVHAITGGSFGTQYSSTNTTATYTYASATPSCSLSFTFERNISVGDNQSTIVFTISSLAVSSYSKYLNDSSLTLFGVYQLSLVQAPAGTTLLVSFLCSSGITNTNPKSMRVYVLGSPNFYNSGAIPTATNIDYVTTVPTFNELNTIIGFSGAVDTQNITLDTCKTFYGPSRISYNSATNSLGQTIEKLVLTFPNAIPTFDAYELCLFQSFHISTYYENVGYFTLYSFLLPISGDPNTDGQTLQYSFTDEARFIDIFDRKIANIQPETFICLCSSSGSSYSRVSSVVSSNTLTCKLSTSCSYLSIVGKGSIPAESSLSKHPISMESGVFVNTGIISSTVYYKIDVPAGMSLTLSSISLLSSNTAYMTINVVSSSPKKLFVYQKSQTDKLSYTNDNYREKTIYVSVEPSLRTTEVTFLPIIELIVFSTSYKFPVLIASIIIGFLFTISSVLIVVISIKRNSRKQIV